MYQVTAFDESPTVPPNMAIVTDGEEFERCLRQCRASPIVVFDFETSGLAWWAHSQACGLALAVPDSCGWRCWYIPYRHLTSSRQFTMTDVASNSIAQLLCDHSTMKVAHNLKFDEHIARKEGWMVCGRRYDTMVAARLYDENRLAGLKYRAVHDLGHADADSMEKRLEQELKRMAKALRMKITEYKSRYGYAQVPIGIAGVYACYDVQYTGELYNFYERHNISTAFQRVWNIEMDLTRVLGLMEYEGMPIDSTYLETLRGSVGGVKAGIEDTISKKLGSRMFNLGSDDELRRFLTTEMRAPLSRTTKGGKLAVDREALKECLPIDSLGVIPHIMKWRDAEKIYSTYTTSIIKKLDANSRLHGEFSSVGTNTGRLASRNPNLQNISSDDDNRAQEYSGKELKDGGVDPWSVRRAFVVEPSKVRLILDYSQIELRVLAYYTKDPIMVDVYLNGGDIHKRTQSEVSDVLGKSIPRRQAKVVNFGLCLQEGQRVLTRQDGLVPIEQVSCWHELWDGVEWVKHAGLVCRGEQEVLTYDGISATPDHKVFTCDGDEIEIGKLASEIRPRRIAIGAIGETPVRYSAPHWPDKDAEVYQRANQEHAIRRGRVFCLFKEAMASYLECLFWQDHQLHLPGQVQGFETGRSGNQFAQPKKAKVYDLVNAGPRHRFTIEGKIVSNSYCLSAQGLARQTGMPQHEADNFLDAFFKRYHRIPAFREEFWQTIRMHNGAFVNRWGRPRRVPLINSPVGKERGRSERQSIGSLIQGTAAELTKESLVRLQRWIDESGVNAKLVSTVHDEIWMDVCVEEFSYAARSMKHIMEDYDEFLPIPVLVDGKFTNTNWAEKKGIPF